MSAALRTLLDPRALQLLQELETAGYETWLVGGALRDALLGLKTTDYDLASRASPDRLLQLLDTYKPIPVGLQYGTVRVVFPNLTVDITTFRVEENYSDQRRPDRVSFTTGIIEDLARRDLTVNALAYHPERGLLDLFGGRGDLEARRLRAVGDPRERFQEDCLRILRALRLAALLDFSLDSTLDAAITELAPCLCHLPRERLGLEWTKLLSGPAAARVYAEHRQALSRALPPATDASPYLAWRALARLEAGDPLRYVAFARALRLPRRWLDHLELPRGERRTLRLVYDLAGDEDWSCPRPNEGHWRLVLARCGAEAVQAHLRLQALLATDDEGAANWKHLQNLLQDWIRQGPIRLQDLALTGADLKGLPPAQRQAALWRLFAEVADGSLENTEENLRQRLQMWYTH